MKITFIRHGEGLDDVYSEIGGWSDRELSTQGVKTALDLASRLKKSGHKYDLIYSSPLLRCFQTAEFIGHELKLRVETLPYLKERNTYGLLSGVKKEVAQLEYPELMAAFKKGEYIIGAERYPDFKQRIGVLLDYLKNTNSKHLLCVTHGHLITTIMEEFVGKYRTARFGPVCIVTIEIDNQGKYKILSSTGITLSDRLNPYHETKKYKK